MSVFKDNLLQGQTALITGGSSGINLGIARRFAEHGANLVILARNPEKLARAQGELEALGAGVLSCSADVRDFAAVAAAMQQAQQAFGALDIVVAGAAGNFLAPSAALSANAFAAVVGIDLLGTFNTFRAALEHAHKPGARFLVISAPQAVNPMPMQAHACAAKAGIEALVKTAAIEWGPAGIRVNGISPGGINGTEGLQRLTDGGLDEAYLQTLPIPRYGEVGEVADMALFLVSEATTYMTGHIVALDGGTALLGGSHPVAYLQGRQGR